MFEPVKGGEALEAVVRDSGGKVLPTKPLSYEYHSDMVLDSRFAEMSYDLMRGIEGDFYFILRLGEDRDWHFSLGPPDNLNALLLNDQGKTVAMTKITHWGFEGKENWGTGRGYIWSRSIPMLKDTLLWGRGADTFVAYFPQNDYLFRYYNNILEVNVLIDKPHCLYIQMAFNTGIASLAAWLVMMGLYIAGSVSVYRRAAFDRRAVNGLSQFAGAGIFLGLLGFLVASLVNDSTTSAMPAFYAFLGTGLALNRMLGACDK